jgi:hypothetical protein
MPQFTGNTPSGGESRPDADNSGLEKVWVTPEIAQEWLSHRAVFQRKISKDAVSRYAAAMRNGDWKFVKGLVIQITPDGYVLDGQHRLAAVVQSGIPQWFMVDFNAVRSNFEVIDRGRTRNLSQLASMAGCEFHSNYHVSAANALLWDVNVSVSFSNYAWPNTEISDVMHYFQPELSIVFPKNSPKELRINSVRGALLRLAIAYPGKHKEIQDFIGIITSMQCNPAYSQELNNTALLVPKHVRDMTGRLTGNNPAHKGFKYEMWMVTLILAKDFINGKSRKEVAKAMVYDNKKDGSGNKIKDADNKLVKVYKPNPAPIWLDSKLRQQSFPAYVESLNRNPAEAKKLQALGFDFRRLATDGEDSISA